MANAYLKIRDKNTGDVYKFFGQEVEPRDRFITTATGDGTAYLNFDIPSDFEPDVIAIVGSDFTAIREAYGIFTAVSNFRSNDVVATVVQYVNPGTASNYVAVTSGATASLSLTYTRSAIEGNNDYDHVQYGYLRSAEYSDGIPFTSGVDYYVICGKYPE